MIQEFGTEIILRGISSFDAKSMNSRFTGETS